MIKCLTWYGAVNAAVPGTPLVVGALLVVVTGYTTFHSRRRRFNARSKKACRRGWHCSLAGSCVTRASRRWPRESAATVSLQAAFQTITDSMPPFVSHPQTTSSSSPVAFIIRDILPVHFSRISTKGGCPRPAVACAQSTSSSSVFGLTQTTLLSSISLQGWPLQKFLGTLQRKTNTRWEKVTGTHTNWHKHF